MTNPSTNSDHNERLPIVGRDSRVDLTKYTVQVRGQDIIDYEKLKTDNPALYKEILADEFEANRKQGEEIDEILARPATQVTPQLLKSFQSVVATEKPATGKYFYLPVFVSNPRRDKDGKYGVDLLIYSDDSGQPMVYASRVLPGQTLAEAVTNDLRKDFKYNGDFQIRIHYFYDTTPDKQGTPLPRLAVLIKVDRFPTDKLHPAGLSAHWTTEGFEHLGKYRFKVA